MRKLSLSEWASVAEVISAVAVVASLIYLAIQVRENTMLSAQEAVSSAIAEFNEFDRLIAVNADLASIIMRGEQGSSSLSAEEQRRFEHLFSIETGIYERWHTDSERTGIGREHDVLMKNMLDERLSNASISDWWHDNREYYPPSFVQWVTSDNDM